MKKLGISILLAGALLASDYSYEITPMLGGVTPEGNLDIDDQTAYGIRFQMNDYDVLGLVPEISFDRTTDTDYDNSSEDTAINRFGFNGLHDFKDFSNSFTPYVLIGLGYEDVEDDSHKYDSSVYGNYGAGVKFKIFDDIALRAEAKHLIRTDDGGNELYYGVGLTIPFGEKAQERPVEEEPVEEKIVPLDSDGDGVIDANDKCPNTPAGRVVNADGCELDSDGDGVVDALDKCPTTPAGRTVNSDGCQLDSDGDGVVDADDKCPNTPAGATVNEQGCELDSDNDGVVDSLDKCANTVSGVSVDKNGCAQSIVLDVRFENASAVVDEKHSPQLKEYTEFMKNNPAYDVEIVGHTDSKGREAFNQKLSEQRAQAVKDELVKGGVSESRITTSGKGESEPVADNSTAEGKAANRRIEAKLKLRN